MRLGIGTATFFQVTSAGKDPRELIKPVAYAVDQGMSLIDTAPLYGFGDAERMLKGVIAGRREQLEIVSKTGFEYSAERGYYFDASPGAVTAAVMGSLERMGLDYLDQVIISYPGYVPRAELLAGWEALASLVQKGLIREIGLGNCTVPHLEAVSGIHAPTVTQLCYSAVAQENGATVIPYCVAHGIRVITHGPRFHGILVDSFTRKTIENFSTEDCRRTLPPYNEPQLSRNLQVVDGIRLVAQRHGASVAATALAFVLRNSQIDTALVGASALHHVTEALAALSLELTDEDIADIQAAVGENKASGWSPE